jgi:prefoldin beta subunit
MSEDIASSQQKVQELVEGRMKIEQQMTENKLVLQELKLAGDGEPIYKVIGPLMVSQDPEEARDTVEKRLQILESQLKDIEGQMEAQEKLQQSKREKLMEIQTAIQRFVQLAQQQQAEMQAQQQMAMQQQQQQQQQQQPGQQGPGGK